VRGNVDKQTTRIVLIRHGQTAWNKVVRFRGQADPPLDDVGLRQARATADYVRGRWPVAAVYSSPMGRAMETAGAVARAHDLRVHPSGALLDIDFGEWQGLTPDEVRTRYPGLLHAWIEKPHTVQIPGGESLAVVHDRVTGGLSSVGDRHRGQTVAMVGHNVVNRVLLCAILGLGIDRFWHLRQDTCAINVFDIGADGQATVTVLNETCHLVHPRSLTARWAPSG